MGNVKYINDYVNKTKAFNFIVVPEVRNSDNIEISSSNIRALLKKGDLDQANDLLTRKWSITGNIQKGEKKARQIGFRTANIKTNKFCQIRRGVYSVILEIPKKFGEKKLFGIANFGIKPTFNKTNPLLEVHIFNFENDIYHERIKMFHVKDAEFNPSGRQGVYGGYQSWINRAGRFRSLGDGQVDFKSIFSKLSGYNFDGWAVLEWECCIKSPEQGAAEGAPFIQNHIIEVTEKAFDDFASSGTDEKANKKILGI